MGRHSAEKMRIRDLRSAYSRLLQTYSRLLREHRRLEAEHRDLMRQVPPGPSTEVELWRPTTWGAARDAMDVETACELVRSFGLLTSAGG